MQNTFKCPRCGHEQPRAPVCANCNLDILKYIEYVKKKRAEREAQSPQDSVAPQQTAQPRPVGGGGNPADVGELLSRSWDIYKRNGLRLIVLSFLCLAVVIAVAVAFFGVGKALTVAMPEQTVIIVALCLTLGIFAVCLAMVYTYAAFILAVSDEGLDLKGAFGRAGTMFMPYLWLFSLLGHIIGGAMVLLIVPGLIYAVFFSLAIFVMAAEPVRGMDAILKSRAYVHGHWFDVFLKFLVIYVLSMLAGVIPVLGPILFSPYQFIFTNEIYKDLRALKGEGLTCDNSRGAKARVLVLSTIGVLLIFIPLTFLAYKAMQYKDLLSPGMIEQFKDQLEGKGGLGGRGMEQWQGLGGSQEDNDYNRLSGRWSGRQIEGSEGWSFDFQMNSLEATGPEGLVFGGTFTLLPEAEPKGMDITIQESPQNPEYVGRTALGVYSIDESGLLTLCAPEPSAEAERPALVGPAEGLICFELAREGSQAAPEARTGEPPAPALAPTVPPVPPASGNGAKVENVSVYVYAYNYKGRVLINGIETYLIKGEPEMNYNFTGWADMKAGSNSVVIEYEPLPGKQSHTIEVKVYTYQGNQERIHGQWVINESAPGRKSYTLELSR